jgi:hypothetical protein
VNPEITPEPSEEERRAILAALAADDAEREGESSWAEPGLPRCGDAPDAPPP